MFSDRWVPAWLEAQRFASGTPTRASWSSQPNMRNAGQSFLCVLLWRWYRQNLGFSASGKPEKRHKSLAPYVFITGGILIPIMHSCFFSALLSLWHTHTCSHQGGKIKCLKICENSHSVASGSDNSNGQGSIHVIKVEYTVKKEGQVNRYTGFSTVQYLDKTQGSVVAIDHFNTDSQSVLVYGTSKGFIHGWDLRQRKEAFLMRNPAELGVLKTFVIDGGRNWFAYTSPCIIRGEYLSTTHTGLWQQPLVAFSHAGICASLFPYARGDTNSPLNIV